MIHRPNTSEDFQSALNNVAEGDTIQLIPTVYKGEFTLRAGHGTNGITSITITTSGWDKIGRVNPNDSNQMAEIVADSEKNQRAIIFEEGANNYILKGLEIAGDNVDPTRQQTVLILMNWPGQDVTKSPQNIIFDQCYIHGTGIGRIREGLRFNARDSIVKHCYFENFLHPTEAYAINMQLADNCLIEDNYLSAAGIPLFFGTGDFIQLETPSRIMVRNNMINISTVPGWGSKHTIELKGGQSIAILNNTFHNVFLGPGVGLSSCIYCKGNSGKVENIYIQDNESFNCEGAFLQIVSQHSIPTNNITAVNNKHQSDKIGTHNRLIQILNQDTVIKNVFINNLFGEALIQPAMDMRLAANLPPVVENITYDNVRWDMPSRYGVKGDGIASGQPSWDYYCRDVRFTAGLRPGIPIIPIANKSKNSLEEIEKRITLLEQTVLRRGDQVIL